ncbi:hypothetical protein BXZ70DRAFT_90151 [Cristinia sonorae]|uniref:Uncharacterized protein n=1 Tax=Cristinia sonorae TaxID=1940300 RepID=A0A8K0UQT5_9AGAR|nr:hypothetical protein BXZ70DRAFT_90151 [Cristinia sonorae]
MTRRGRRTTAAPKEIRRNFKLDPAVKIMSNCGLMHHLATHPVQHELVGPQSSDLISWILRAPATLYFILGTLANGIDTHMSQNIFVVNRGYPGFLEGLVHMRAQHSQLLSTFYAPRHMKSEAGFQMLSWYHGFLALVQVISIMFNDHHRSSASTSSLHLPGISWQSPCSWSR